MSKQQTDSKISAAVKDSKHERAEIIRAFALLKERARGWLAKQPDFIRCMSPAELRLMADAFDDKPGAIEAFEALEAQHRPRDAAWDFRDGQPSYGLPGA